MSYEIRDNKLFYKDTPVASAIEVVGQGRDENQGGWSKIVRFSDPDGVQKVLALSSGELLIDWRETLKKLMEAGLQCSNSDLLKKYLLGKNPSERYRLIKTTGWYGGSVFVLPEQVIGTPEEALLYCASNGKNDYSCAGTLQEWQENIGKYCQGNDRLILGVSLALAGPLLKLVGLENGGVHLVGQSSTGKSTIARVASSVWGAPTFLKNWRTTDNGMEFLAASRNDTHLGMDELNQADPTKAGKMSYLLGNGEGKVRGTVFGGFKDSVKWNLLILSTGEKGFSECALETKGRYMAGQEVRMAELPARGTNYAYGAFQTDHGLGGGKGLAEHLNAAVRSFYGTPAIAFLERLVEFPKEQLKESFEVIRERMQAGLYNADGQVLRVAKRFALIALAGSLGVEFGVLPWDKEETIEAIHRCCNEWVESRGGQTAYEEKALLAQVKLFLEQNSDLRFAEIRKGSDIPFDSVPEGSTYIDEARGVMAGYKRKNSTNDDEYLVFPQVFKEEICKGQDFKYAKDVLVKYGWLLDKSSMSIRIGSEGQKRVYLMSSKFWDYNPEAVSSVSDVSSA